MRYLAIDLGDKRTGLAAGDDVTGVVGPLSVITMPRGEALVDAVLKEIEAHNPDAIVIGLPLNMDGTEGEAAKSAREFGAVLESRSGKPVHYQDERLSEVLVEQKSGNYAGKVMLRQGGQLEGIVYDLEGKPCPGIMVKVQGQQSTYLAQSSESGVFRIVKMTPGSYEVSSQTTPATFQNDPGSALATMKDSIPVFVAEGETAVIDLLAMPFAPGELERLLERLEGGEVSARIEALGETLIRESRFPGAWVVDHYNTEQQRIALQIEITDVPRMLCSQREDIAEAAVRLAAELEE